MYLEETADKIVDYISDWRYKQAVLVNGAWGVGKTYFVQKTLLPKLSDNTVVCIPFMVRALLNKLNQNYRFQ